MKEIKCYGCGVVCSLPDDFKGTFTLLCVNCDLLYDEDGGEVMCPECGNQVGFLSYCFKCQKQL